MFSGKKSSCYNRSWVQKYVESENSEGKEIKIDLAKFSVFLKYFITIDDHCA
jgi:hypothetical protein